MDIVSLWDKTLQLIKGELSPPSFNAFFKQIIPLKIHPMSTFASWIPSSTP